MYGDKAKINFTNMDEGYGAVVEITIPVKKLIKQLIISSWTVTCGLPGDA